MPNRQSLTAPCENVHFWIFSKHTQEDQRFFRVGVKPVNKGEYDNKYFALRLLKSIQDFLKAERNTATAVYPIKVPDDFLYQVLKFKGPEEADKLIAQIFKLGLELWSEQTFIDVFGSSKKLEEFVKLLKDRSKEKDFWSNAFV